MIFENDLLIEEKGYNDIIKPFLKKLGLDSVFIRYSSKEQNVLFNYLNKTKDIDFITDNGKKNQTISLKVVQKIYDRIFFETIKNTFTKEKGWGYYSQADYLFYLMLNEGDTGSYRLIITTFKEIRTLNVSNYAIAYGKTTTRSGRILYKTEGRLILLSDFNHKKIENNVSNEKILNRR